LSSRQRRKRFPRREDQFQLGTLLRLFKDAMMQSEGGTSKAYSFWFSLFPLYFVVFFVGAALSIILPSVAPYLKQVRIA